MMWPSTSRNRSVPLFTSPRRHNLAEQRIVDALQRGELEKLPGESGPLPTQTPSTDEPALLWALKGARQGGAASQEADDRERIDDVLTQMDDAKVERQVFFAVRAGAGTTR